MIEQHTAERITCSIVGPRNDLGRNKLIATITDQGLLVYCLYCRSPHLITRETCIAVWERTEPCTTDPQAE